MNKYEILTNDSIIYNDKTLYRIRLLKDIGNGDTFKAGEIGGYIENEFNLSQDGECWVDKNSKVIGNVKIYDNALINNSTVTNINNEESKIHGESIIVNATVNISGCDIYDNAKIIDINWLSNSKVYGDSCLLGTCLLLDDSEIKDVSLFDVSLAGSARIFKPNHYGKIDGFGLERQIEFYKNKNNGINVVVDGHIELVCDIHKFKEQFESGELELGISKDNFSIFMHYIEKSILE